MAATFKIHEDEDVTQRQKIKGKDVKQLGKRCVLGQIQNNYVAETYKGGVFVPSKSSILPRDAPSGTTGFTETIKALDLKDKDRRNHSNVNPTNIFARSPLRDLRSGRRRTDVLKEKVESPMSVDSSPLAGKKCESKEINKSKPFNTLEADTPVRATSQDEKHASPVHVESPMSVDVSPKHSSRTEVSRTGLEDLYGCYVYKQDIYKYLRKIEEEFRPKAYYMRRQPDVSYSMRTILVDWLVEVGEEYKLRNETLFMAVSYIDRFLSTMAVAKPKLQLLGTSAMFVAAKFEEIYPPDVGEFTYITDDTYSVKQLLRMERLILKVLSFDLSCPTSYTFIMHISSCVKLPSKVIYLAMYICELSLLEADPYLEFVPSLIASGAIALARHCLDHPDVWPASLAQVTGYTLVLLGPVISHLNETHHRSFTLPQTAIRQKYKGAEYECVSQIPFKRLVLRDRFVIS